MHPPSSYLLMLPCCTPLAPLAGGSPHIGLQNVHFVHRTFQDALSLHSLFATSTQRTPQALLPSSFVISFIIIIITLEMTTTHIMEEISKGYLEILANRAGYFNFNGRDYGTDLLIRKAQYNSVRNRYLTSGKAIDIQVKATHEKYVSLLEKDDSDIVKFSMEVKNYNDLIDRANESDKLIPLILVVFIFPDDESEWINLTADSLLVKRRAYWYNTGTLSKHSQNTDNITISIPKQNIFESDTFDKLFNLIGK